MTDGLRAPHPELAARILPKGAAVILRDYRMPGRAHLAARLKSICAARGVKLLIGADPELAARLDADGVHCPRWFALKGKPPRGMIISASCHNARELERAKLLGAGALFLSPAFQTESHDGKAPLGAAAFRDLAASAPAPVLALGGVTAQNARLLSGPNVAGLAAIGAFIG